MMTRGGRGERRHEDVYENAREDETHGASRRRCVWVWRQLL
jgi:hypothetical protein